MEKYLSKKIVVLSIFALFIFLISFKLLNGGVISYTDSSYRFPSSNADLLSTWSDNYLGVSQANGMSGFFMGYLSTILEKVGLNSSLSSYLINFLPVLILCLIAYSVTRKISGSVLYGYFAGLFIILNNFILEQFSVWPGVFFFNVISLVILFFLTYKIYNSGFDFKKIIYVIINSFLILQPFFFVMYFAYWVSFSIFYCINKRRIKNIYSSIVTIFGIICIHCYWLFPFLSTLFVKSAQAVYNGNLIPVLSGYESMASYVSLFNFHNYPESSPIFPGGVLQYIFYFGLLIIFTVPLLVNKYRYSNKKDYVFLMFLFVTFLLFFDFALGPNSKISGGVWMWAFNNIPGFGFFRSFTRFLIIPLIAMMFAFGLFFKMIKYSNNKKNIIICVGIIFLIIPNLAFFSGNLNGILGTIKVPKEYYYMNNNYFKNNNESFSIITLPTVPYEAYKWSINSGTNISHQMTYFDINFFSKPVAYGDYGEQLQNKQALYGNIFNLNNEFDPITFDESITLLNVKYIIVNKDFVDNLDTSHVVECAEYYQFLKGDSQYILKEDNEYFALFENTKYSPTFSGDGVSVNEAFPAEYTVSINNLTKAENFEFAENYDPGWGVYINKYNQNEGVMSAPGISYLWRKPIFDSTHQLVNDYANGWTIDPNYIKQNFDPSYYKVNPDGSIDIELTLYFKPQSYFYVGLIVSGTTLLACLGYLGWDVARRRKW